MAKKKNAARRVPRSGNPPMYGDGQPSQAAQQTAEVARPSGRPVNVRPASSAGPRRPTLSRSGEARLQVPLAHEYGYVAGDLKRLSLLAASTFVIMIVLGILIH